MKGVVIGMNAKTMDVIWDVPFMSGTTLGDRYVCSIDAAVTVFSPGICPAARSTAVPRWSSRHA